jgi:hypothetical protein
MERPHLEVADVFRRYGPEYRLQHAGTLSHGQQRVMSAIERCSVHPLLRSPRDADREVSA